MSSEALATCKPPLQVGVAPGPPADWREATLGDLFAVSTPGHWGDEPDGDGNIMVLRSTNFRKAGGLVYETAAPRQFDDRKLIQKRLLPGDIILERSGGSPAQPVGRARRFDAEGFYSASNFMQIMRAVDQVDDWFACYLLDYIYDQGLTEPLQKATTGIRNLDFKTYLDLPVSTPPLDEQRRIAEVLRSVDEAIAVNVATLASCRTLVGKLAQDVTQRCEDTTTMASLGKVVTGRTPSPKQADLWGGDLPFVTPGDLVAGNVSVTGAARTLVADSGHGATVLPANSVLVTCIGSTVGKTAIARERCVTNQQINAICCPPQIAGFVYLVCVAAYDAIVANAGKQAVPIINKSAFSGIKVPSMSRAEMAEISAMVDAIDSEIDAAQTTLDTLHRTKTNLMSDLLSGRVRVPA